MHSTSLSYAGRRAGNAGGSRYGVAVRGEALPPSAAFSPSAVWIAVMIMAVVAVRLQELFPVLAMLKPVMLLSFGGSAWLFLQSSSAVRQTLLREPLAKLVLTYYAWILFTIPFALWTGLAFGIGRSLVTVILMFVAFLFVAPERRNLERIQTWLVALVMIYALYVRVYGRISGSGRLEVGGGMYDSNDMAAILSMALPLAAGLVVRSKSPRARAIAIVTCVAIMLTVISSGSRGGALALAAGAVVFALGQKGMRGMIAVLGLSVGLAIAWVTAPASFQERMLGLGNLEDDYNYTHEYGRKAVWERGRGYIRDNPIVGVGVGNFPVAEGGSWEDMNRGGKWSAAHNAYIQAAAELGIFGGALFIGILLMAGRHAYTAFRAKPNDRGPPGALYRPELLASLASFAVGAYFLSHAYFPPLFALVGIIALTERTARTEASSVTMAPRNSASPPRAPGQRGGLAYSLPAHRRASTSIRR